MASSTNVASASAAEAVASYTKPVAEDNVEMSGVQASAGAASLDEKEKELAGMKGKWPGWPGYSVFRVVVPALKVGGIIGRNGDLVRKLIEETRSRIRVIEGPLTSPDRIVLISAKEEPEAALPPALDAIIRIFKLVNGLTETDGDDKASAAVAGTAPCSIKLLVPFTQGISLIGKGGCVIKSIQEGSGAILRILPHAGLPIYVDADERIVELQGETLKVLKALKAVMGHLRKFLVDESVLSLFEKNYNGPATEETLQVHASPDEPLIRDIPPMSPGDNCPHSRKRDSVFPEHESRIQSVIPPFVLSPSTIGQFFGPFVSQVSHTMQLPLSCAEDIIGVQGSNIDYIRRTSGATLTVQESRGLPDKISVEIKGTSQQVQTARELIHEFTGGNNEDPLEGRYSEIESRFMPFYSQFGRSSSSSSPFGPFPSTPNGGGGC